MKISDTFDPKLKRALESDNERALRRLMSNNHKIDIPLHTSNMRMLETDDPHPKAKTSIRRTIIPDMSLLIDPRSIRGDQIAKYGIRYMLTQNNKAFPLAHVYSGGGSLCLGGIFVPTYIPKHSPQQPIETLFLHNDRLIGHGNPQLNVSNEQRIKIIDVVYSLDSAFPINVHHDEWIKYDTLWRIGEYMLAHYSREQAFKIMRIIFAILFDKNKTSTTE